MPLILSGDTGVPASGMPTGSVIQTVSGTSATTYTTASTSFTATGLTATITPQFSNSKVFILVNGVALSSSTAYQSIQTIYRNSTNLGSSTGFTFVNLTQDTATSMSFLDSPATTSATTYTVYFRSNGGTAYFGDTIGGVNQTCVITLMEIRG